jgi:two-component sensor histidine kinase
METLAQVAHGGADAWLDHIVTSVAGSADVIRVDRAELWELLDNLPVAILISTDRECSRMIGNRVAQTLLRMPMGSNLSQSAPPQETPDFEVWSDGNPVRPEDLPMQRAARTGCRVSRSECEIRFKDGARIFIAGHCIPLENEVGEVCGSLGAFIDVTQERTSQENTALVAREMAHRVKNTVALIQALAHGTIRHHLDPADYEVFDQRLVNLAQAQDLIDGSRESTLCLNEILARVFRSVAPDKLSRVEVLGPAIEIGGDLALSLSMVFHEFATNACKYGALKNGGTVTVSWSTEDGLVSMNWREDGRSVAKPITPGFGSELVERIFRGLPRGQIDRTYNRTGLEASLRFAS